MTEWLILLSTNHWTGCLINITFNSSHSCYPHFTDERQKVREGKPIRESLSQKVAELRVKPRSDRLPLLSLISLAHSWPFCHWWQGREWETVTSAVGQAPEWAMWWWGGCPLRGCSTGAPLLSRRPRSHGEVTPQWKEMCEHLTWYMERKLPLVGWTMTKNQNFLWFWFSDSSDSFLRWEEMLDARTCPSVNIALGLMNRGLSWLVPYSVFGTNINSESCWFLFSSLKCGAVPSHSKWVERKKVEFWNASETPTLPVSASQLEEGEQLRCTVVVTVKGLTAAEKARVESAKKSWGQEPPTAVTSVGTRDCSHRMSTCVIVRPHKSPHEMGGYISVFSWFKSFFFLLCPRKDLRELHSV